MNNGKGKEREKGLSRRLLRVPLGRIIWVKIGDVVVQLDVGIVEVVEADLAG